MTSQCKSNFEGQHRDRVTACKQRTHTQNKRQNMEDMQRHQTNGSNGK